MGNPLKIYAIPPIINIRAKYYRTLRQRIIAKTPQLSKSDKDQQVIKRLQTEIKLLSFKFRAVFDRTDSYFIILDLKMNIVDCNKAASRLIKKLFGKKMIVGENITNFLHPSSANTITESCDRAFSGKKHTIEREVGYLDNKTTWWSFDFSPAKNLRGKITGLIFNANDITRRKAYEAKVLSQREKLMEIASIQSHQVRGPVCTIMALMSLIKDNGYEADREYLLLLETTTDLLDNNIRDIVKISSDE